MFNKIILPAFLATLIGTPLNYFLNQSGNPATLVSNILLIFAVALVSACLAQRTNKAGRTERMPSSRPVKGAAREQGNVKWFNVSKGFGFITRDGGEDIFVHFRSIRGEGHRTLRDGQRVEFSVCQSNKGLQADDVTPLKRS